MIELGPKKKIILTGAGGWLGTELLELLLSQYGGPLLQTSVICLGSQARVKHLSDGTAIPIIALDEDVEFSGISGVVHLAFQTRDKVNLLGIEKYCFTNLTITSRAIELIEQVKPKWVATVSSGAIFSSPYGPLENNLFNNPYGFTKRVEETMLKEATNALGANLAIGRLWGAMGANMPVNRAYAVSDFIYQAINNGKINIRSANKVWRRYCDAAEFMNVLTSAAETLEFSQFDSGGTLIEVGDLASKISTILLEDIEIERSPHSGDDDKYFPEDIEYINLATTLNIKLRGFDELLSSTINKHSSLLK